MFGGTVPSLEPLLCPALCHSRQLLLHSFSFPFMLLEFTSRVTLNPHTHTAGRTINRIHCIEFTDYLFAGSNGCVILSLT
ncbi:hypothetical protein HBI56_028920 [Parastagonospora nodorum]|uniref:Uncharacterized protein n=1 Tax=Phaeosphaeria nodorum (strain SN15 / ATCC MYA-4574 / FGSC 10173) TaxID=321614 RepID=A0A7U2EXV5_PHANO|nr:hypothetical protein HBH56_016530 [Parastagonospora nodorum]QRC95108.1 hypothetical protein JI435_301980 [Parastagonospora nodorum SN15]KAH3936993.1 hypothetical protein HBH54_017930 [Parastagonospora nodorum]KAH3953599.1 hypothetical protein HBH53_030310 [Parastagonospora nodorum]KAH3969472.1 hypothetical protein HBH51_122460 [Parastagonospora nodorum]